MALVAWDTDQIKRYVFATPKLREIRGASALLDDLNEKQIPHIVGKDRMVFAGGGTAMAIVSDLGEAEALIQQVEGLYRRRTKSAEITGACLEMSDAGTSFGEYARRLNFKLRATKDSKTRQHSLLTSPVLKACDSCGQSPAESESDENIVCQSCLIKRQESRRVRDGKASSRLQQLLEYANARGQLTGFSVRSNAPQDFNDIGEASLPSGYIGFIYCDGNRMGALLSQLTERDVFSSLSEKIRGTLREATFDALCQHFRDLKSDKTLPFEIIFIGGDDVVLVTAADKAIDIAIALCSEFERRSETFLKDAGLESHRQHLTMSAAVVLAHASLPIYHLQAIADDLLKSSKRRSLDILENQKAEVGCVDFHVVTASASDLPSLLRRTNWERRDGGMRLDLTERPYTDRELERLVRQIRALRTAKFPSSKLQMIYESIVDQSMVRAMSRWAFVAGRARRNDDPTKDQLINLVAFLQPADGASVFPWRRAAQNHLTTPMVDVAELYDFIR